MHNNKRYPTLRYFWWLNTKYRKRRIKRACEKRFKMSKKLFPRRRMLYPIIYWTMNAGFYPTVPFNAYQGQFKWVKQKFINFKYHALIRFMKKKNEKIRFRRPNRFKKFVKKRFKFIQNFLYIYNYFFSSICVDLFYLTKIFKLKRQRLYHFLIFSFTKGRLFINLQNFLKKNYFFLSTGLFIKFFEKKKSLKKSKIIKFLMAKYLRKLFLITRIRNAILIIKKTPLFFLEIMNLFNTPVVYKFVDPVEDRVIEEKLTDYLWIKFPYFIFSENKNFSNNKKKKRGRIKRKIFRKVVFNNKIID